jgi:HPt (histidine-containing phosphotransfer) domain-containing protein
LPSVLLLVAVWLGLPRAATAAPDAAANELKRSVSSGSSLGSLVVIVLGVLLTGLLIGQVVRSQARRRRRPGLVGSSGDPPAPRQLAPSVQRSATLVKIFLQYAPAQVEALGAQLAAADAAALAAGAHKLRGSCLAIGALPMAELCAALEAGDVDPRAQYAELVSVFTELKRELAAELAQNTASH